MDRRAFIGTLASGLLAAPLAAGAQQANRPVRIGFLPIGSPANAYDQLLVEAFRQGLREAGVVENRDVVLDVVWVSSESGTSQAVSELMGRGAQLLVPGGSSASLAAQRQASTIPIVFIHVGNPVGIGLVESLAQPGGNATGLSDTLADLSGKLVELARELRKSYATVDYLWYTGWQDGQHRFYATERAAKSRGMKIRPATIDDIAKVNDVMSTIKKGGAVTLIVQPSPFTLPTTKPAR